MRIAALYDIHGNAPALEAVLRDVQAAAVDRIVIGGDVIPGPMPQETIALLRSLSVPVDCIQGNGEREVLVQKAGHEPTTVPPAFRHLIRWAADNLAAGDARWMSSWPATLRLGLTGMGPVLFCHATPRNDTEIFTRLTPDEPLLPIFSGLGVSLVVCGHTHMQDDRRIGDTRVVNAGSVGMPFGAPGAFWLLLGSDVQLRRTSYDLAGTAARIRASNYPQAEEFASRNVLQPPTEAEILAAFSKAEIKPAPAP